MDSAGGGPIRSLRRGKLHPTVADPAVDSSVHFQFLNPSAQKLACEHKRSSVTRGHLTWQSVLRARYVRMLTTHCAGGRRFLALVQRLLQDAQCSALADWPQSSQQLPDRSTGNLQERREAVYPQNPRGGVSQVSENIQMLECVSECVRSCFVSVRYLVAVQQGFSGGGAQPEGRVKDPETQTVSQILPASFTLQSATQRLLHLCVQARQVAYTRKHVISKPMRRCHDFVFRGYETMNHV